MEKTAIIKCTCAHAYQDAQYGKGNRVGNHAPKSSDATNPAYRCTVCGKVSKK